MSISASTVDRLLLCGDVNSPGLDAVSVSSDLAEVLAESGLQQHVNAPTRCNPEHLDVIATDPKLTVRDVRVHDAGLISDHRLVLVTLVADQ